MHTATLLSTLSILASCASAGLIPRQDADIHIADFRTWGGKDCKVDNQGIWTFTKSDLTGCKTFASFGADNIQSINLNDIATGRDIGAGCSLYVYYGDDCGSIETGEEIHVDQCLNTSKPEGWKSFLLYCRPG